MSRFEQNYKCKLIGKTGQSKLSKAKILIVGAGGTGCPVFVYLQHAGIGNICICDDDKVQKSNLNRQFLYDEEDVGELKTDILLRKYDKFFNEQEIYVVMNYNFQNWLKYLKETDNFKNLNEDLIIDCTDNYDAKLEIQKFAKEKNIPCIISGVHGYQIQIFSWHPKYSKKTYDELFSGNNGVNEEKSEGTFPTTTGILGTMVANEAIKILLELDKNTLFNRIFFYNVLTNEGINSEIA